MMRLQQKYQESLNPSAPVLPRQSRSDYADRLARLVVLGRMPPAQILQHVHETLGLEFDRPEAYSDWIDLSAFCPNVKQVFETARLGDDPERPLVLFLPPLNSLSASISALLAQARNPDNTWIAYYRANHGQVDLINLACLLKQS